jgi:hypothetical protein
MFGLMKAKTCGLSDAEKLRRRLHYCGTCKTMGALYGQKTRFLLNHDTVFLAEILTALQGEHHQTWQKAYQSYNCLTLPTDEMPLALEFAATANVVLTEFKIKDHIADEQKTRWTLAQKTFSNAFKKAALRLQSWQFPLEKLHEILAEQSEREKQPKGDSPTEVLAFLAEPTAMATALFFSQGARTIDCSDEQEKMFQLGYSFGKLIYILDAIEDFEKDVRANRFNALQFAFQNRSASDNAVLLNSNQKLPKSLRLQAARIVRNLTDEVFINLGKLPLDNQHKQLYSARLLSNIERKLKADLPVLPVIKNKVCEPRRKLNLTARWNGAKATAKDLTSESFGRSSWKANWQYIPAFLIVALIAFIAPQEAAKAKSWQDCAGLGFNLMFLGSIIGAVLALPLKMAANLPPDIVAKAAEKAEKKRREGWCDGCCNYECCNCCDACSNCDGCKDCDCGCCNCCDGCGCDCGN